MFQAVLEMSQHHYDKAEETLNKISEMFFTTKKKGSGLGVSLSKEIIEQHNGTIVYDSLKDKGTKVVITLPKTLDF